MSEKMISVQAMVTVRDNGIRHQAGEIFDMEESLVAAHVAAKQIRVAQVVTKPVVAPVQK